MPITRKLVKVFLASPGDLSDERRAAKAIVDEFNADLAGPLGYQVELVGWEDTVSTYGRPQATINRELEQCELFVGLMWRKWGSPPAPGGRYTSGFEEEYRRSVARRKSEQRPEISLLFKEIGDEFLKDPGDDLKKVIAFREELIAEKAILFEKFQDAREFERKFRRCITKYVTDLRERESAEVSGQSQAPATEQQATDSKPPGNVLADTPLSNEGATFLRGFVSRTESNPNGSGPAASDVARFRLLATVVRSDGNDELTLGVHDANLLYSERRKVNFGQRELIGLLDAALEHYDDENVPLWHWLAAAQGFDGPHLPLSSAIGPSTKQRQNAIAAMRLISEHLPDGPGLKRELFIASWLNKDTPDAVRVAALGYLGEFGTHSDLPTVQQEFERGNAQSSNSAAETIIRINLRDGREKAVQALFQLQPAVVDTILLREIFENDSGLSTDTLLRGIDHRNSNVRRLVAEALRVRGALPAEIAEKLLEDSDADVRYEALQSLISNGRTFSDQEARAILIRPIAGRGGLGRLLIPPAFDSAGEVCWAQYKDERLRSLKDSALEEAARESPMFDREATFVLAERHFRRYGDDLRRAVDDGYKAEVSSAMQARGKKTSGDLPTDMFDLESSLRKNFTTKAIAVICRRGNRNDLQRVRSAIATDSIDYSAAVIEYLEKHGEWQDIPSIIQLLTRLDPESRASPLFAWPDKSKYATAAKAIHALGRSRLKELLSELIKLQAPDALMSQVLLGTSLKAFRDLDDNTIASLFQAEDSSLRKTASLMCVRALTKRRITKLLADYLSGSHSRYYNVIHWLDLGVSAPSPKAAQAAQKALSQDL